MKVYGPNGFFREFKGNVNDPRMEVLCNYEIDKNNSLTGNLELRIMNHSGKAITVEVNDNTYTGNIQIKQSASA